jgi:uncharacterized membrane protein YedE/YeeE
MNAQLTAGLVTGILFGILLQRSEVIRYDRQVGAMRFMDMTIVKFMLSAIVVGMVGIYQLYTVGEIELSVKGTVLGTNIAGGLIFGLGWALLGYCPGTAAGALGEGRIDGLFGMLGMIVGAMAFAEFYPLTKTGVLAMGDLGKVTIPMISGVDAWVWIPIITALYFLLFNMFDDRGL